MPPEHSTPTLQTQLEVTLEGRSQRPSWPPYGFRLSCCGLSLFTSATGSFQTQGCVYKSKQFKFSPSLSVLPWFLSSAARKPEGLLYKLIVLDSGSHQQQEAELVGMTHVSVWLNKSSMQVTSECLVLRGRREKQHHLACLTLNTTRCYLVSTWFPFLANITRPPEWLHIHRAGTGKL